MPFSGRYLTRLFVLASGCVFAIVALSLPRLRERARSGRPGGELDGSPAAKLQTALAPSPFGELGLDVIVSDGRPKQPEEPPDELPATPRTDSDTLPPVDRRLLANVLDKTSELYHRPYYHLVTLAAQARAELLERDARRDVAFIQLWNDPEVYRGELVFLKGHLHGLVPIKPMKSDYLNPARVETLYQGHLITDDSQPNPYIVVLPRVPENMPTGKGVVENITFAGYFFKLWKYSATDAERAAPVLIGQMLTWTPAPRHASSHLGGYLAAGFIVLVMCMGGTIWLLNRRQLRPLDAATADGQSLDSTRSELAQLEKLDVHDPVERLDEL